MTKTIFTVAALALVLSSPTIAGTRADGCAKEPQAQWLKAELAEQKARADGYDVSKSKVAGTCYEVYATKAGNRFELFYHPMTLELVEAVPK
jgi:hypothetical protein